MNRVNRILLPILSLAVSTTSADVGATFGNHYGQAHAFRYYNEMFSGYLYKESETIDITNKIMKEINPESINRKGRKLKWIKK